MGIEPTLSLRDAEEYRRAREGHHQAVARASFAIQAVDS
jgi:hypothetical protein